MISSSLTAPAPSWNTITSLRLLLRSTSSASPIYRSLTRYISPSSNRILRARDQRLTRPSGAAITPPGLSLNLLASSAVVSLSQAADCQGGESGRPGGEGGSALTCTPQDLRNSIAVFARFRTSSSFEFKSLVRSSVQLGRFSKRDTIKEMAELEMLEWGDSARMRRFSREMAANY